MVSVPPVLNESPKKLLQFKRLDDLAYIRFENSLGNQELIAHFDSTLSLLRDSKGLILDLRNTPGGGNTTVARAILGRFIDHDMPYQKHLLPQEEKEFGVKRSWLELASPRGHFVYRAPVVVLVDHWTSSMGEGLAIGLNAVIKAPLIGTEMAGLLGATTTFELPNTHIALSVPTEKLFHIDGTAREAFIPTQRLPDIAGEEDYLDAAVKSLRLMQRGEAPTQTGSQR
jgi:carboxyl-terminal processing protease